MSDMGTQSTPAVTVPARSGGQARNNAGGIGGMIIRLAVLLLVLGLASWIVMPTWYVEMVGISTQGTVKSLQDCGGDGSATAKATLQFRDRAGQTHLASTLWCASYGLDESLSIRYLPDHPAMMVTERDLGSIFALSGLIASFDLVFLALFVKAFWQRLTAQSRSPV